MHAFSVVVPRTVLQVLQELTPGKDGTPKIKAGGVDLLDLMKEGIEQPARLVQVRRLQDEGFSLSSVRVVAGADVPEGVWQLLPAQDTGLNPPRRDCVRLGALVTLSQLDQPLVQRHLSALWQAVSDIGTPQVRNMATLAGNLFQRPRCFYFRSADYPCAKKGGSVCFARNGENDFHSVFANQSCAAVHPSSSAVALCALDAVIELASPLSPQAKTANGPAYQPRFGRLSSFLVAPDQPGGAVSSENRLAPDMFAVALWVPVPFSFEKTLYRKVHHKQSFDWPLCEVAIQLRRAVDGSKKIEAAKIVLGSVAPVPYRAKHAEALLVKSPNPEAALAQIGQAATTGATPLAKNGYKLPLLSGLVQQTLAELLPE